MWVKQIRHGAPLELAAFIEGYAVELKFITALGDTRDYRVNFEKTAERVSGYIYLVADSRGRVVIDFSVLPNSRTLLRIRADVRMSQEQSEESWANFSPIWQRLCTEMDRVGFTEQAESDTPPPPNTWGGRPRHFWNQRAIDRLLAGEDEASVRVDWRAEYEVGTGISPSATDDGEEKTWNKRVWNPYREARAKGS